MQFFITFDLKFYYARTIEIIPDHAIKFLTITTQGLIWQHSKTGC